MRRPVFESCQPTVACLAANECAKGHEGLKCASCTAGHFRPRWSETGELTLCKECGAEVRTFSNIFVGLAGTTLILGLYLLLQWDAFLASLNRHKQKPVGLAWSQLSQAPLIRTFRALRKRVRRLCGTQTRPQTDDEDRRLWKTFVGVFEWKPPTQRMLPERLGNFFDSAHEIGGMDVVLEVFGSLQVRAGALPWI